MITLSAEGSVVLKVKATNPSEFEEQEVVVKSYLPRGIKPENVIDRRELELAYDVKQGQYYVYKEVKLKPKESVTYAIEIEDIWLIDTEKLNALKIHTDDLVRKLKKTEYEDVAEKLAEMIDKNIAGILEKQGLSTIDKVSPIEHIAAYEANKRILDTVKEDVGTLENLVISLGGDPGVIMGESSIGAKTVEEIVQERAYSIERIADSKKLNANLKEGAGEGGRGGTGGAGDAGSGMGLAAFNTVILKVEIENPSPAEVQIIPLKYYLPSEVKADDVIDAKELELGFDFEKELYYLFKDEVRLEPAEKKVFEVLVRDKWSINEADLLSLKLHAENMVTALEGLREFASAQKLGKEVIESIDELLERKGLTELTDEHIAAFREDVKKLEEIKKDIQRMEEVLVQAGVVPEVTIVDEKRLRKAAQELGVSEARLRQIKRLREARKGATQDAGGGLGAKGVKLLAGTIFRGKAPSTAATWRIIFIIIGFLGIVSLLFFLRWHLIPEKKPKRINEEKSD
jgi:uncharacterized membrane protein YuzA (DUF378 family)